MRQDCQLCSAHAGAVQDNTTCGDAPAGVLSDQGLEDGIAETLPRRTPPTLPLLPRGCSAIGARVTCALRHSILTLCGADSERQHASSVCSGCQLDLQPLPQPCQTAQTSRPPVPNISWRSRVTARMSAADVRHPGDHVKAAIPGHCMHSPDVPCGSACKQVRGFCPGGFWHTHHGGALQLHGRRARHAGAAARVVIPGSEHVAGAHAVLRARILLFLGHSCRVHGLRAGQPEAVNRVCRQKIRCKCRCSMSCRERMQPAALKCAAHQSPLAPNEARCQEC